jgi:hypothetical protein
MCDPAGEVEEGRGGGEIERISRQPVPVHPVAGVIEKHDDHDQPSIQIHGLETLRRLSGGGGGAPDGGREDRGGDGLDGSGGQSLAHDVVLLREWSDGLKSWSVEKVRRLSVVGGVFSSR